MANILQISPTPNPFAMKFYTDVVIARGTPHSYPNRELSEENATAKALFTLPYVKSVFFLEQVVTVNIGELGDWDLLIPDIQMILENYLTPDLSEEAVSIEETGSSADDYSEDDDGIAFPEDFLGMGKTEQMDHINRLLDKKVRPGLAGDGGGLDLIDIQAKSVIISYMGACGSCPSSTAGTLNYIQSVVQSFAHPELTVELA